MKEVGDVMRILILLPLLTLAVPAAARDRDAPRPDSTRPDSTERAARAIADPRVQGGVVLLLDRFNDILLDTRVGPAAALADRRDDIRPNDTLRDIARRDDPNFDRNLRAQTRSTVATAGRAAGAGLAMSKEIERTADRLGALLDSVDAMADDSARDNKRR